MFQYSFSLCLVAFFFAILRLSDGRRRRTLLELSTALGCRRRRRCPTLVFAQESAAGVGSFQPLNGQMRDIKQFALASFSESFAGYSSYLVRFGFTSSCSPLLLFFCAKVFYYYMYFLFLVDLWVGHFICTYSWAAQREEEGGHAKCLCACWSILFGAAFRHGFGQDLCSVVGCFYLPFGCVCLHGKCPSARPTVRPAVRLSRPACRYVLSCVLFM